MFTKNTLLRLAIVVLIVNSLFSFAYAQKQETGIIKGSVKDEYGPVVYARAKLEGTSKSATTNEEGFFEIRNVLPGTYNLIISDIGYKNQSVSVTVSSGETLQLQEIILDEDVQQLSEVTVTGNKTNKFSDKKTDYVARLPLSNLENPQVYSVVNKEIMEEQQVTDVQGALQNATGVNNIVEGVGSGGVGLSVNLRGFSTGIAMRNGMAVNYITLTDPVNLERLEIIKGPSATLFGSTLTSYGGLINRVTKQPEKNFKGEVGYSTGSFGLSRITADINTPLNEDKTVLFRVTAAKHSENSFQDHGRQRNWAFNPTLEYQATDRLKLNLETELYNTTRPSAYFGISPGVTAEGFDGLAYDFSNSYNSDQLQSQAKVYNVFARATYKISDQWESQTNISSGNTDNEANYLFLTFLDNSQVKRMPMNIASNFHTTQVQQNFIGRFNIGSVKNKLLVGLNYYHLTTSDRRTRFVYDTVSNENPDVDLNFEGYQNTLGQTDPFFSYKRDSYTYSAYASDVVNITDQLSVMASLRVDHFVNKTDQYEQTTLSPKLGAVYQIVQNKVSVFTNYMDGFTNVAPDVSNVNNAINFKPEHATQVEGGIKANIIEDKLNLTFSYYNITVKNIVRSVPDNNNIGGFNSVQDGTKNSKGFEAEIIANLVKGWNILAGYGYNDSRYTKAAEAIEGNRPYSTPNHSLNFWTSYQLQRGKAKGLGIGFGGNYVSESYLDDANTFRLPSYTVLNTNIFYNKERYRIGIKINNLTNENYWTASYWAMPQKTRNVVFSFAYKF